MANVDYGTRRRVSTVRPVSGTGDRRTATRWAASILPSTIITSNITLLSVVLTVMTVAVQLAPEERQAALDEQRELLDAAVRRAYDEEPVIRQARIADMQGLG